MLTCPVCNKVGVKIHYKCKPNEMSKDDFKWKTFQKMYPELELETKYKLEKLYIENEYSLPRFKEEFQIDYDKILFLLDYFKIKKRTIQEACSNVSTKSKREKTNLERFGEINPLSKNTSAYHKRNNTVKEKYGVDNVRQLQSVKDKINETMLQVYGVLRIINPEKISEARQNFSEEKVISIKEKVKSTISMRTDEQKSEIIRKRFESLSKNVNNQKENMNKFESLISMILTSMNIPFSFSHYIKGRQFDFIISDTKVLIECNGDFWHANPLFYLPDDILSHPGKKRFAKNIWAEDYHKFKMVSDQGYIVKYIWENSIKNKSDDELRFMIINLLEEVIHQIL